MSGSPFLALEKKHWWLTNRKLVGKYVREARWRIETEAPTDVSAALGLLDAALALSPQLEAALELKVRSLLFLRRFREVEDMLQDYIPSYRAVAHDDNNSAVSISSDNAALRERAGLLRPDEERSDGGRSLRCFSGNGNEKKVYWKRWGGPEA